MVENKHKIFHYLSQSKEAPGHNFFSEAELEQLMRMIMDLQLQGSDQSAHEKDYDYLLEYELLINNTNDLICSFDTDLTIKVINQTFKNVLFDLFNLQLYRGSSLQSILKDSRLLELQNGIQKVFDGQEVKIEHFIIDELEPTAIYDITICPLKNDNEVKGGLLIAKELTKSYKTEEALVLKNEELNRLNDELDKFVYSASHDLRAPIASILGLLNISDLENNINSIKQYINMMKGSVQKLDQVISSIISYSWNSHNEIVTENINIKSLIEDIIVYLDYLTNRPHTNITLRVRQNQRFFSDPHRLRIIIKNLIVNAIQFQRESNDDKKVEIHATVSDEKLTLKVSDNGRGIPSEYLSEIFNMFVKLDPSHSGAGLGLYMVKQALNKLDGNILVSSEYKKGSTFTLQVSNQFRSEKKDI